MNNNYRQRSNQKYVKVSDVASFLTKVISSQTNLLNISIRGEISNYKPYTPRGKKVQYFFDVKDEGASIRCISYSAKLFQNQDGRARYKDGDDVIVSGQISYYAKTGYISFRVNYIEKVGKGKLHQDYLETKEKLLREGLFDQSRKKQIKRFPNSIGIVTARTSAACADVERTIQRRSKFKKMVFFDTIVQGINAPKSIINSLKAADKLNLDVIVMCRGGGSEEDLFCFSEEAVVRQVAAMRTPIVTGIGHEVDTSLSDLASDRRASTPTAAAESVTYVEEELLDYIDKLHNNLEYNFNKIFDTQIRYFEKDVVSLQRGMTTRINKMTSICDTAENKTFREIEHKANTINDWFNRSISRLSFDKISSIITNKTELIMSSLESLNTTRTFALGQKIGQVKNKIDNYSNILKMSSPDTIIQRGYAAIEGNDGKIIKEVSNLTAGQDVSLKMRDGVAKATIKEVKK